VKTEGLSMRQFHYKSQPFKMSWCSSNFHLFSVIAVGNAEIAIWWGSRYNLGKQVTNWNSNSPT